MSFNALKKGTSRVISMKITHKANRKSREASTHNDPMYEAAKTINSAWTKAGKAITHSASLYGNRK